MIYRELESIPLANFIEVFMGNLNELGPDKCSKEERKEIAESMINEYFSIVGGKSLLAEISRNSEFINLSIKVDCVEACKNLIKLDDWEGACEILSKLGYGISPTEKERINKRIESILSVCKYRRDTLLRDKKEGKTIDRNYFTRERVIVMSHFKMHVNKYEYTAKEYAYLVKRMCDDMNIISSNNKGS